jgi:hypothetical protein
MLFLRLILILFTHISLGLARGLFLSGFPTRTLSYAFLFSPYVQHVPPPLPPLEFDYINRIIFEVMIRICVIWKTTIWKTIEKTDRWLI